LFSSSTPVVGAEVRDVDQREAVAERDAADLLARLRRDRADRGIVALVPLLLQRGRQVLLGAVVQHVGEPHLVTGQQEQDQAERDEGLPDAAQERTDAGAERAAPALGAATTTAGRRARTAAPAA
jgi:hypothetical protein